MTAADPDAGATLAITAPVKPAWLTFTDTGNGTATLSGTPANADVGPHTVTLAVSDGLAPAVTQTFTVTVGNVNDAPVFTSTPVLGATQGVPYLYGVTAADPDAGATLAITAPVKPAWLTLTPTGNGTATLSGTPANADVGSYAVTLQVTDGASPVLQTFTVTVDNVNDAPVFTSTPVLGATEDVPYGYGVTAADPDAGATLAITAPVKPAWLTLTPTGNGTATLGGTPANADVGPHPVTLAVSDGMAPAVTQTFTVTVIGVNDAPVIGAILDPTMAEDSVLGVTISVADQDTALDAVAVSATSSNVAVVPNAGLVVAPQSGSARTLTIAPAANASTAGGPVTITLTATDGLATSVPVTFRLTITEVNDLPSISGGSGTACEPGRRPNPSCRVLRRRRRDGARLARGDGGVVRLPPVARGGHRPRRYRRGADRQPHPGVGPVGGCRRDPEGDRQRGTGGRRADQLHGSCERAPDDFRHPGSVHAGGHDAHRRRLHDRRPGDRSRQLGHHHGLLQRRARPGLEHPSPRDRGRRAPCPSRRLPTRSEPRRSAISVFDGALEGSDTFVLRVTAVNDVPTISAIGNQQTNEDTVLGPLSFSVGDPETAASALGLEATSSDTALLPLASIAFGGGGSTRTVTLTPVPNGSGQVTVTLTVVDADGGRQSTQFVLEVIPLNDAPAVDLLVDQSTLEDVAAVVSVVVADVDTPLASVTLTATSSNPAVVVPGGIAVDPGSGAVRTLRLTPLANAFGTTDITVTAFDGALSSAPRTFRLTVTAVNDAPTIGQVANQTTSEDTATPAVAFTVGDVETAAAVLAVTASSSDTTLLPVANIVARRQRGCPDPHPDAGVEPVRRGDGDADGVRRHGQHADVLHLDGDGGQRPADDLRYRNPDHSTGHRRRSHHVYGG